ncbi:MAG: ABC-type transport auxiliary lipoprotein family protein [Acidovorax sp.]
MKTIKFIAASARPISATVVFGLIFALAACSALPQPPARATTYDFGPGPLQATAAASADAGALPPLSLADVEAQGQGADTSTALNYRLAYADAQQLRPYVQARWSQPPAALIQQRLRETLGQRRAILSAGDQPTIAKNAPQRPAVLRVTVEEFSQVFQGPAQSTGLLRLRATVADGVPAGEVLVAQRVFTVQRPAPTADAAGGARALAAATDQAAQEIEGWLETLKR